MLKDIRWWEHWAHWALLFKGDASTFRKQCCQQSLPHPSSFSRKAQVEWRAGKLQSLARPSRVAENCWLLSKAQKNSCNHEQLHLLCTPIDFCLINNSIYFYQMQHCQECFHMVWGRYTSLVWQNKDQRLAVALFYTSRDVSVQTWLPLLTTLQSFPPNSECFNVPKRFVCCKEQTQQRSLFSPKDNLCTSFPTFKQNDLDVKNPVPAPIHEEFSQIWRNKSLITIGSIWVSITEEEEKPKQGI